MRRGDEIREHMLKSFLKEDKNEKRVEKHWFTQKGSMSLGSYNYAKSSTPFPSASSVFNEEKGVKINFEHTYVSLSSCSLGMIQFALPSTAGVNSPF